MIKSKSSQIIAKAATHDKPTEEETGLPDLEMDLTEHRLQCEVDALRQQVIEAADTHNLRIDYANKIFWLVCIWLACVIGSILLSGFQTIGFLLSEKVLITFIATTTLNVLGLFAIVAKWMFPQNGKQQNQTGKAAKN